MTIRVCRVCSVEHKIQRHRVNPELGICPICEGYHALYPVLREQRVPPLTQTKPARGYGQPQSDLTETAI